VYLAAPVFHIRRRLAWHGVADPAAGSRLGTGCARELPGMGRPSAKPHDRLRNPPGRGDSLDARFMDAHRGNDSGPRGTVEGPNATRR